MLELLGMPPAGSSHAGDVDRLMVLVHWLMAVLFVGWSAFFLYVLVRFRRASQPTALHHGMRGRWSTWIEGGVLAAEIILLAYFSVPAWSARVDAFPSEQQSTVVRVERPLSRPGWPVWPHRPAPARALESARS
jgi:heme/copper-type cytochrome/quinol oxidase subunit 2